MSRDNDLRIERDDEIETLEPFLVGAYLAISVYIFGKDHVSPANTTPSLGTWTIVSPKWVAGPHIDQVNFLCRQDQRYRTSNKVVGITRLIPSKS